MKELEAQDGVVRIRGPAVNYTNWEQETPLEGAKSDIMASLDERARPDRGIGSERQLDGTESERGHGVGQTK